MFYPFCVVPHFFQPVKLTCFCLKHMRNNIHIIYQHPLQGLVSFMTVGQLACCFLHLLFYGIRYSFYLYIGSGFTNNKKIRHGLRYFTQVKRNDIFSFFLLNCVNDRFK